MFEAFTIILLICIAAAAFTFIRLRALTKRVKQQWNEHTLQDRKCCICGQPPYVHFCTFEKSFCKKHLNNGVYYEHDPHNKLINPYAHDIVS